MPDKLIAFLKKILPVPIRYALKRAALRMSVVVDRPIWHLFPRSLQSQPSVFISANSVTPHRPRSKKEWVIIISQLNEGGAVRILGDIMRTMSDVSFSIWYTKAPGPAFHEIKPYVKNMIPFIVPWKKDSLRARIREILSKYPCDGFINFDVDIDGYFLMPYLKETQLPIINWIHTYYEVLKPYIYLIQKFSRYIDFFLVTNDQVKSLLLESLDKSFGTKIRVLINGIDTEKFLPKTADNKYLLKKFNLPDNKEIVTFVGRFDEFKNPLAFVGIAKCVLEKYPQSHFVLAGDGHLRHSIEKEIKKLGLEGQVSLVGFVNPIQEILRLSSIVVATTLSEGLTLSVAEAMSMQIPVVVSDIESIRILVREDKDGYLVPVNAIEEFSKKVVYLLEHQELRRTLGVSGRQRIIDNFSLTRMTQELKEILTTL